MRDPSFPAKRVAVSEINSVSNRIDLIPTGCKCINSDRHLDFIKQSAFRFSSRLWRNVCFFRVGVGTESRFTSLVTDSGEQEHLALGRVAFRTSGSVGSGSEHFTHLRKVYNRCHSCPLRWTRGLLSRVLIFLFLRQAPTYFLLQTQPLNWATVFLYRELIRDCLSRGCRSRDSLSRK